MTCICAHSEHDGGLGECFTSGCKCRSYTEPEPLTVEIVRRAFAVAASSPVGGQDVFEHSKEQCDRWLDEAEYRARLAGFLSGWTAARTEKTVAAATHSRGFTSIVAERQAGVKTWASIYANDALADRMEEAANGPLIGTREGALMLEAAQRIRPERH